MKESWREQVQTPCYVIDIRKIKENLECLKRLQDESGCRILLAQKAFSCYPLYDMMSDYLWGATASGLYEARLGKEEMRKEIHVYTPAYKESEFEETLQYSDHIVFNSPHQLQLFGERAKMAGKSLGIRINPQYSTQKEHAVYDPCAPYSRLGTTRQEWDRHMTPQLLRMLDGIHFHTLCEQDAPDLLATLNEAERQFADVMGQLTWINFGGGHHITRNGYHTEILLQCIARMQRQYGLTVYLEPGEAIALDAGYLVTTVLDIVQNQMPIAILDTSAACHMTDVLEMPYRPPLKDSFQKGEGKFTYRLAGATCLSGDIIGDYSFETELEPGRRLIFEDMAIYTMVKNNTFNGLPLPAIYLLEEDGRCRLLKKFGYEQFKERLG